MSRTTCATRRNCLRRRHRSPGISSGLNRGRTGERCRRRKSCCSKENATKSSARHLLDFRETWTSLGRLSRCSSLSSSVFIWMQFGSVKKSLVSGRSVLWRDALYCRGVQFTWRHWNGPPKPASMQQRSWLTWKFRTYFTVSNS